MRKFGLVFCILALLCLGATGGAKADGVGTASFGDGHDWASAVSPGSAGNYVFSESESGGTVVTLTGDVALEDHIELTSGDLTLDLAGGHITRETGDGELVAFRVTGGRLSVVNSGERTRYISAGDHVAVVDGGLLIFGGTNQRVTAQKSGRNRGPGASVVVKSGEARILSGTVSSTLSEAVRVDAGGRLEVLGGQIISGGSFCVHMSGGTASISGGELRGSGGVAVRGGSLEMSGGSVNIAGTGKLSLGGVDHGLPAAAITTEKGGSVAITGDAKIAGPEGGRAICFSGNGQILTPDISGFRITGGVFSEDVSAFLRDGWICREGGGGWRVSVSPDRAQARVTRDGETDYFASLAEAVESANGLSGSVEVELLEDGSGPGFELGKAGEPEVVLDLGGHSFDAEGGLRVPQDARATVKNGALGGAIENRGDLNIENIVLIGTLHSVNGLVEVTSSALPGGILAGYCPGQGSGTRILLDDSSFQTLDTATVYSQYSGYFPGGHEGRMMASVEANGEKYGVLADGRARRIEFRRQSGRLVPTLPGASVSYVSDVAWVEFEKTVPAGAVLWFELSGGGHNWTAQKTGGQAGFSLSYLDFDRPGRWPAGVYTVRCYVLPGLTGGKPEDKYLVWEKSFALAPEVQPAQAEVRVGDGVPAYARLTAQAAGAKTKLDEDSMDALAALAAKNLPAPTEAELEEAARELGGEAVALARAYLSVEVESCGPNGITYDILPMARMVATTSGGSGSTVPIGEARRLPVTEPVTMTLGVPDDMSGAVYVCHEKADGAVRWYTAVVRDGAVTFENPHGFSRFSVTNLAPRTVARVGGTLYGTLQEAAEDVREGEAIMITGQSPKAAIVGREVSFAVENPGNFVAAFLPAAGYSLSLEGNIYTFSRLGPGGVTLWPCAGGTVWSDTVNAAPGRLVTVTAEPEPGQITVGVTVRDARGGAVRVTGGALGRFYFVMPGGAVTVEAGFAATAEYFADAPESWYAEAIAYAMDRGFMDGVGEGRFAPNSATTRAQLVTILYRLEGEPEVTAGTFADVPDGQWYSEAVSWAATNGIVDGVGNDRFAPSDALTREQMAKILYGYAQYKGIDVTVSANLEAYADASTASDWAAAPISWAVSSGLISGTTPTTLSPTGSSTRAQTATILMRLCENLLE